MPATAAVAFTLPGKPLGLSRVETSALVGLEAHPIVVEVCSTRGPPFFQLVGLAEAAVREARVRVATALAALGVLIDEYAITINLAPADLRKSGAELDVAIATALLGALGHIPAAALQGLLVLGELGLDGTLRPIRGVLPQLDGARLRGLSRAIVPVANAREAGLIRGLDVFVADSLDGVRAHLAGGACLPRAPATEFRPVLTLRDGDDLSQLKGQSNARRALEIAAAGGHNLLFVGPPGGGKTLLARLLPTILPPLSFEEAIEATAIHSVAGLVDPHAGVIATRPFRAPHHSVSDAGLVGGGDPPRPGEVSLAHNGILFLDELAEFRRSALEALRQPLEDGTVCIARARSRAWFPARPLLVAAANPCPCGWFGHPVRRCRCPAGRAQRYLSRLSGPLLDRIDLHVQVPPVEVAALATTERGESSTSVRERVARARNIQVARRRAGQVAATVNAALSTLELEAVAPLSVGGRAKLASAVDHYGLSARAYVRVLRVARTIADLEGSAQVTPAHLEDAVQGRLTDRSPFI